MNKKSLLMVLVLMLSAVVLAACATPTPAATPSEMSEATEVPGEVQTEAPVVKLILWNAYSAGSAEESTLTTLIENAKVEFPNYQIEVLNVPFADIFNKYQTEVAAGGGPDMYVAPNDDLGNWVRGSFVENLDTYLDGKLDGVAPVAVDGMKVDGSIYGVPESAKAVALYYNTSLLATPPATTDEMLAAIKGGARTTFFIGAYHMFGWSGAFGGKLLDDSGKCVADQGGWKEALQFLLDAKAAGAEFYSDYSQAEGPFREGKVAMFVNGPWALGDYKKDLGDKLGVAVMPAGTAPAGPLNGIDGFYINPNSAAKADAVALALFLTGDASAQLYTNSAGHVPIRDSVKADDPLVTVFAQASASGFPRPQSVEFGNYWTPFGDMFTKVLEGKSTPEAGVAEACAAMNTANGK
jgi:arabinogalactan oligomer/maltooligosaccharide transport system substrate-binding protein